MFTSVLYANTEYTREIQSSINEPIRIYFSEIFPEEGNMSRFFTNENMENDFVYVQGDFRMEELRKALETQPTEVNILRQLGLSPAELSQRATLNGLPEIEYVDLYLDGNEVVINFKNNNHSSERLLNHDAIFEAFNIRENIIYLYEDRQAFTVRFEEVKFSRNELEEVFAILHDIDFNDTGISSMWVDTVTNQVKIGVSNTFNFDDALNNIINFLVNEHKVYDREYYLNIIHLIICEFGFDFRLDDPKITKDIDNDIEKSNILLSEEEAVTSQSGINITFGSMITTFPSQWYSAGFPLRNGFVTTGHGSTATSQFVYRGSATTQNQLIGFVSDRNMSASHDSAFVTFYSGNTFTNNFSLIFSNTLPVRNSSIAGNGAATGSRTMTVLENNVTISDGHTTWTQAIIMDGPSSGGDSGGPYFRDSGNMRTIFGIHRGVGPFNGVMRRIAVQMRNINH